MWTLHKTRKAGKAGHSIAQAPDWKLRALFRCFNRSACHEGRAGKRCTKRLREMCDPFAQTAN